MTHTNLTHSLKLPGRLARVCAAVWAAAVLTWTAAAQASPAPQRPAAKAQAERLTEEGAAALGRDDRAAAREFFRRALEADEANVTAHTYLGVLADQEGDL